MVIESLTLMATYEIRLMFEWGGSCLWGMNDAAKAEYGYSEIEKKLPLSNEVKNKLASLSKWHDTALDWNSPLKITVNYGDSLLNNKTTASH